jgi:hypothetical protein
MTVSFSQTKSSNYLDLPITKRSVNHMTFLAALVVYATINFVVYCQVPRQQKRLTERSVLGSTYETAQRGPWGFWLARAFFKNKPAPIVLMGDSQMNAAIFQADAATQWRPVDTVVDHEAISIEKRLHEKHLPQLRVFNLATSGSFISDQYFVSQALFPSSPPSIVILGIGPRMFMDSTLKSVSSTDCFKYFSPYVDFESSADSVFIDQFERFGWILHKSLPLLQLHETAINWSESLIATWLRRDPKTLENARFKTATPLNVICTCNGDMSRGDGIVRPTKIHLFADNSGEYVHRYRNPSAELYNSQLSFFCKYLIGLRLLGTRVVVVGMPSLAKNRMLLSPSFWQSFKETISSQCTTFGAEWLDLTEDKRFKSSMFLDNVHLNQDGGLLLTDVLSDWISVPHLDNKSAKVAR